MLYYDKGCAALRPHLFQQEGMIAMKKRFLAALMAVLMLGAVTGCSENGGSGDAGNSDKIRIGGLAPLTGDASSYGVAVNNGILMAVEDINADGGINGKQIEYIYYDEKGDATEAVNAYNKLVQNDQVVAIIGDVTTKPTLAVAQQSQQDNIPIITASATAAEVTTHGRIEACCENAPAALKQRLVIFVPALPVVGREVDIAPAAQVIAMPAFAYQALLRQGQRAVAFGALQHRQKGREAFSQNCRFHRALPLVIKMVQHSTAGRSLPAAHDGRMGKYQCG